MAKRTKQLAVVPWDGGLVTAHDPSLLAPGQLTAADNITMRFSHDKTRRDGIDYDWDNSTFEVTTRSASGLSRILSGSFLNTGISLGDTISIDGAENTDKTINVNYSVTGTVTAFSTTSIKILTNTSYSEATTTDANVYWSNKVIGAYDYWFQTDVSKTHFIMSVLDNGMVFANADGGVRHRLNTIGQPWTIQPLLSLANMETINNILVIAPSGPTNQMVFWNGDITMPLQDLPDNYNGINTSGALVQTSSITKSSAGSIRTIQFNTSLNILAGSLIVVTGDDTNYTGTYELISCSPTSLATVTYAISGHILTQSPTADTLFAIGAFAPLAQNLRQHLGALWCDDKTSLDALHYSGRNQYSWSINGTSDGLAGETLVGDGDGDPAGISGIAPSFQGILFVGKRTKLYRIDVPATNPPVLDNLTITKVSDDIGFLSHQSVCAVEQTDLVFASERGLHSMTTTNAYGDFLSSYLSMDINRTFSKEFTDVRKPFIKVVYVPEISGILMAVSDNLGNFNNAVYGYNLDNKRWYRWTGIEAESMCTSLDNSVRTLYLGGYRGRLLSTLGDLDFDIGYNGQNLTIPSVVRTGLLYMGNTSSLKLFKEVRVFLAPQPNFSLIVTVKVDNQAPQSFNFTSQFSSIPLGEMVLGFDPLGKTSVSEPYALPLDGQGRAIQVTFSQNDTSSPIALLGYAVDYIEGDKFQETNDG